MDEKDKAHPERLLDLVRGAYEGRVVLPEFQRSFVWSREDIEELLVSILRGYFIGTFLLLDTSRQGLLFPYRVVEGVEKVNRGASPENYPTIRVVLDGQQRLTSLFYVLYKPEIPLLKSKYSHIFYLNLNKLFENGNPDDAVCGISTGDQRRLSEMEEMEKKGEAIPFSFFLEPDKLYDWMDEKELDKDKKSKLRKYIQRFTNFEVPVVSISSKKGEEDIVNIFERINRTGISLSLFDLVTARLYQKGINLRDLWKDFATEKRDLAKIIKPEFILRIISIWQGKEPRKGTLLEVIGNLSKGDFEKLWKEACHWLVEAYNRVISEYGALNERWIPYTTLLVPLAVLLETVNSKGRGQELYRKIDRWYWGSVFTQRYDQAVESTTYQDVRKVREWLGGESPPEWIKDFQAEQINLKGIEDQRSSIYRGLMCLIVKKGAKDFHTGQKAELTECHDDHIFPKAVWRNEPDINSILNRTLISSDTNRDKHKKRPSEYLKLFLKKGHGGDINRLQETLESHFISKEAREAMERNDFSAFLEHRERALKEEINRRVRGEDESKTTSSSSSSSMA